MNEQKTIETIEIDINHTVRNKIRLILIKKNNKINTKGIS